MRKSTAVKSTVPNVRYFIFDVFPLDTICNAPSTPCETYTTGGTANGATCQFPFIYKDALYYQCTGIDHKGRSWCSTTYNFDIDQLWGNCAGNYDIS